MGGNVFKGTIPVKRDIVPFLYKDLKEKLNLYNSKVVGSSLVKKESSDLDIAIWQREFPDLSVMKKDFEHRKVGANFHLKYEFENDFYQIDFFKCGNESMADFFYKAKSLNSKYSADHRAKLLFDFFRECNPEFDGEKLVLNSMGLFDVLLNDKGKEISRSIISNNPDKILSLYCKGLKIQYLNSFESLLDWIQLNGYLTESLIKRYLETLRRVKKEVPEELLIK